MGQVVKLLHKRKSDSWGGAFDETVRHVWAIMEDYAEISHGEDWKNLRALMEEFDDVKELSASEKGTLLMQLVEEDECGTERQQLHFDAVKVKHTNIFDDIRGRLKRLHADLEKLKESSELHSKHDRESSVKRCRSGRSVQETEPKT